MLDPCGGVWCACGEIARLDHSSRCCGQTGGGSQTRYTERAYVCPNLHIIQILRVGEAPRVDSERAQRIRFSRDVIVADDSVWQKIMRDHINERVFDVLPRSRRARGGDLGPP